MAIICCEKGHYYDDRTDSVCPICENGLSERAQKILEMQERIGIGGGRRTKKKKTSFVSADYDTVVVEDIQTDEGIRLESVDPIAQNDPHTPHTSKEAYDIREYGLKDAPDENVVKDIFTVPSYISDDAESIIKSIQKSVLGWLVCLQGPDAGRSIELNAVEESVGLYPDRTICIGEEARLKPLMTIRYHHGTNTFGLFLHTEASQSVSDVQWQTEFPLLDGQRLCAGENLMQFVAFCKDGGYWKPDGTFSK